MELLAIGAGPSSLGLAVAIEELAPADLASNTLLIEQHADVAWQRGMLLPWTQSQVSFLKDLVTLRNPQSKYTFVNYLHSVGRLDEFVNMANFLPFRREVSDYLLWVANSLGSVRIAYERRCTGIEAVHSASGEIARWRVHLADGSTIVAQTIVLGIGRDPHVPQVFRGLPPGRVVHSTQYSARIAELDPQAPHRVVVIGAAQSAAEMLWDTHQRMPHAQCTMVMRSIGLEYYQTSRFTNELYFPSFTDEFYAAPADTRVQVLSQMRRTNYAGVAPGMLDAIFRQIYLERLTGEQRLRMLTLVDVEAARMDGDDVVLTLFDRKAGRTVEQRCDLVMLGTGFDPKMPHMMRDLAKQVGVDEIEVTRAYRMVMPDSVTAGCYLQGVNEASHGIADSLMSVIAIRAGEIVKDLLDHRAFPSALVGVAGTA